MTQHHTHPRRRPGRQALEERLPELENLKTVKQLTREFPHLFTEGGLRWLIFNAPTNGFDACIVRQGRKVFIDTRELRRWLAQKGGRAPALPEPKRRRRRAS